MREDRCLITIREYTNEDRQAYLVVYIVGYYHSLCRDWLFRYPLFTEVPHSDEICLIAYENEIPVGMVKIRESEDLIDINEIVVLPEYRQKGVAKALVKKLEVRAKEKGIGEIMATVPYGVFEGDPRLEKLLMIYEHLGFHLDGIGAWISSFNIPEGLVKAREQRGNMIYVSEKDLQKLKERGITPKFGKSRNYDMIKQVL